MHARHITFDGFTNVGALWTVKAQKPEMLPPQGENPPMDFSLLGFVPGLLCASLRASSPAV